MAGLKGGRAFQTVAKADRWSRLVRHHRDLRKGDREGRHQAGQNVRRVASIRLGDANSAIALAISNSSVGRWLRHCRIRKRGNAQEVRRPEPFFLSQRSRSSMNVVKTPIRGHYGLLRTGGDRQKSLAKHWWSAVA